MNPQEYIASGILESYILGFASEAEQKEVEHYTHIFPEISLALNDLGELINVQFSGKTPPPNVRERIETFEENNIQRWKYHAQAQHENTPSNDDKIYIDAVVNDTQIKVHKYWRPAFITVFILGKIFLIAALYFYFKSDSLSKENLKLQEEIKLLKK
ncbi:hypothetical protein Emtol_0981 [Emticicia oligotrophica DSM 17448]|uniref:Uncharacterized protein n=1 Tax=Emticicia oligotrophica (strain DSM 17448 / CIP 109782 / MTCC 6937 / GPTSA100-15) TaxID=929562 RepID=A0ABM5MYC3_EMTOG|nr:hypothetical protein [Emticicia oligotrophica]AFK02132.1 hypothetical protein Emtol_0981 [Emticicia oligotrophica DSM 17448]